MAGKEGLVKGGHAGGFSSTPVSNIIKKEKGPDLAHGRFDLVKSALSFTNQKNEKKRKRKRKADRAKLQQKRKRREGREEEEGGKDSSGSDHRRRRRRSLDQKPVMPSSHFLSNFVPRYEWRKEIMSSKEPPTLSPPSPEENLQIKREVGTNGAHVSCRCHQSRRQMAVTVTGDIARMTSPVFFKALSLIPQTTHKINFALPLIYSRLIFNYPRKIQSSNFFSQETASKSKSASSLTRNRIQQATNQKKKRAGRRSTATAVDVRGDTQIGSQRSLFHVYPSDL